eukprot:1317866-Pleurochrysis_carterae.AAC.2
MASGTSLASSALMCAATSSGGRTHALSSPGAVSALASSATRALAASRTTPTDRAEGDEHSAAGSVPLAWWPCGVCGECGECGEWGV